MIEIGEQICGLSQRATQQSATVSLISGFRTFDEPKVTRPTLIVDTNVVIAGLLTTRNGSSLHVESAHIYQGMLSAAISFALSEALLAEYRAVFTRAELCERHGLTADEIDALLRDLAARATMVTPVKASAAPDPGDQLLWELLAARADLLLVTGDKLLLKDAGMRGRVVTPKRFLMGA